MNSHALNQSFVFKDLSVKKLNKITKLLRLLFFFTNVFYTFKSENKKKIL